MAKAMMRILASFVKQPRRRWNVPKRLTLLLLLLVMMMMLLLGMLLLMMRLCLMLLLRMWLGKRRLVMLSRRSIGLFGLTLRS